MWRLPPRGLPATGAFLAPPASRLGAEDDLVFAATAVEPSEVTAGPARRPPWIGNEWVFVPPIPPPDSARGVGLRAAGPAGFRSAAPIAADIPSSLPRGKDPRSVLRGI